VVLANIGIAEAERSESQLAVRNLAAALEIDPDLHEARFNLALVHARAGRREEARAEAEDLLRRLPPSAPQRKEVARLVDALR
jgi:tetratricopeptide (TPR) repeat protein